MTPPSTDRQAISKYYDQYSTSYEAERREGYYSVINDLEFEKIQPLAAGKKTLEVGCGTGLILERVHRIAADATGVDISPGMLEVTRNKGLKAVLGSATDLPFADRTFDLVYSFKVLAHVPEIKKALAEIARVTKPDGRMVLEFYNPYSFKGLSDNLHKLLGRAKDVYLRLDSLRDIKSYLAPGTRIVSTRGIRIFAPVGRLYSLPGIGKVFRRMERSCCDGFLRGLGGYFAVEIAFEANPGITPASSTADTPDSAPQGPQPPTA